LFESAIFAYQHLATNNSFDPAFSSTPIWAWPLALGFGQLAFWQAWMWYGPLWSIAAIWWATVVTVALPTPKKIRPEIFLLGLGVLIQIICIYRNGQSIAHGQMFYGFTGLCRALVGINLGLILRRQLDARKYRLNQFALVVLSAVSFSVALVVDQKFHERAVLISGFLWVPVVLLLVAVKGPDEHKPVGRLFLAMGKYSFPIFIWHVLIIHIINNFASLLPTKIGSLIESFPVQYVLVVAISLVLSIVSTNTIEPWIRKYLVASGEKHLKFLAPTSDSKLV
jgi:peptidoglycan/LPS O-acetylase OafA/YrhL